ncbi:hypothetical protein [Planctomycetes bacterium K23_9]|uniref:Uncharacterized protein n=1 Tax=Stieleria marina TaxID=1930275 RepID=A0A517NP20_9BACT|nr:hypothetical protein K239x_08070 [Planctomycetes bacterium K23_9]
MFVFLRRKKRPASGVAGLRLNAGLTLRKMNASHLPSLFLMLLISFPAFCGVALAQDAAEAVSEEAVAEYEAALVEDEQAIEDEEEFVLPPDPETAKVQAYLAVQRGLITRVCNLTDDQEKKLSSMNNRWLAKVSKENEPKPNGVGRQPGLIGMFFGVQPQRPRAARKQNLKKIVDEQLVAVLDDDQKKQLKTEQEESAQFRHAATADALLESLQDRLDMTAEQRTAIKEKILPWVSRSDLVVVHYFNGNNYYPDIPLHLLTALTPDQRKAYQGLQRHLFTHDNFNDGNEPIVIEE